MFIVINTFMMPLCWMWSSLTVNAQVRECSEKFLHDLERCWRGSILMSGIADIVIHHAQNNLQVLVCMKSAGVHCAVHCSRCSEQVRLAIFQLSALRVKICVIPDFQVFVKYCSNQLLQDQTLKRLK